MRSLVLAAVVALLLTGCSSVEPVEKARDDDGTRKPAAVPFMRIGRGVTNIALSPVELFATMWRVSVEYDEFGYGAGVFQGLFNAGARLIWGAGEACTFFFIYEPDPVYDRPLGERIILREEYQPADMPAVSGGATKPGHTGRPTNEGRRRVPLGGSKASAQKFVAAERSSARTPSSSN